MGNASKYNAASSLKQLILVVFNCDSFRQIYEIASKSHYTILDDGVKFSERFFSRDEGLFGCKNGFESPGLELAALAYLSTGTLSKAMFELQNTRDCHQPRCNQSSGIHRLLSNEQTAKWWAMAIYLYEKTAQVTKPIKRYTPLPHLLT